MAELELELQRQRDEQSAESVLDDASATEAEREAAAAVVARRRGEATAEALRQLKEAEQRRRQEKRSDAWAGAHQHKFIALPDSDEPPFCIVCRERRHEAWTEAHTAAEKQWRLLFESHCEQTVADFRARAHALLEHGVKVTTCDSRNRGNNRDDISNDSSSLLQLPPPLRTSSVEAALRRIRLPSTLLPPILIMTGLSLKTPLGELLPQVSKALLEAERMAERQNKGSGSEAVTEATEGTIEANEAEAATDNVTSVEGGAKAKAKAEVESELGLMVRVWNWEDERKGDFLGHIVLDKEVR
jgi:hypothetical protein